MSPPHPWQSLVPESGVVLKAWLLGRAVICGPLDSDAVHDEALDAADVEVGVRDSYATPVRKVLGVKSIQDLVHLDVIDS